MSGCEPHREPNLSLRTKGKTHFFVLWCSHCWSILSIAETETTCCCWEGGQGAGSATEVFITWFNGFITNICLYNWGESLGNSGEQLQRVGLRLLLLGSWSLVNSEIEPAQFVREYSGVVIYKWTACEEEPWGVETAPVQQGCLDSSRISEALPKCSITKPFGLA